eukprot:14996548-Alexandrium_andersonii.AAC.1
MGRRGHTRSTLVPAVHIGRNTSVQVSAWTALGCCSPHQITEVLLARQRSPLCRRPGAIVPPANW